MTREKLWRRSENWVSTDVDDAMVMLGLDSGRYVYLNNTAIDVWEAIETPNTIEHIVDKLLARYAISAEHCRKSVTDLLVKFEDVGLVSST